ncbi:phage tail terminator-like protein [Metapseudomonas otitidis]|uniref:phage tail terminator-like protein n=1 Tax=Metapseudomonas otitidis TaxID=319939 RepID=UPI0024484387|nr:phage tail terminator-like protein [Pseudomonas otitidis]MDG9780267.1 DUF4128 domain-containing protein [Pseudomonas otitidis]
MSNKLIRAMLEKRLKDWAAARSPTIRVAYEGLPFDPGAGETYLRSFVLPATTGSEDLEGAHRRYEGVWQVSVITPSGDGAIVKALGIEDELAALFTNNLKMTKSGFDIYIRSPMASSAPIVDSMNTTLPISCRYRADT